MSTKGSEASEQALDQLTELFHLLSDRTRLRILLLLARGERNVSSLCEELALAQPTVSHHLGRLRAKNWIANRRAGKQVYYGLDGRMDRDPVLTLGFKLQEFAVSIGPLGQGT